MTRPLKVFLSHAQADSTSVHALHNRLVADGIDSWLAKEKLVPGQDWEYEIRKAVREADVVIVCLSKHSNKRGYAQKEIRMALDEARMMPEGEIFIIPARLEECKNLESLRKWHWVNLFENGGYEKLMRSLHLRANTVGSVTRTQSNKLRAFEKHIKQSTRDENMAETYQKDNSIDIDGNVSNSVIATGNGNVFNITTQSASQQTGKEKKSLTEKTQRIRVLIEFGEYEKAHQESIDFLYYEKNNSLVSLLASISYALDIGVAQLSNKNLIAIEKRISIAIKDYKIRPTALAVFGCIKYEHPHFFNLLPFTIDTIKEELQKKTFPIEQELLNLIDPTPYELKALGI
ncbi:MAG: hypothetical protein DRI32_07820 [Chloroflexi bacterium]|nr:MAG: hypothetical protein DRI32_07820 [Chloroflexota bacterium]